MTKRNFHFFRLEDRVLLSGEGLSPDLDLLPDGDVAGDLQAEVDAFESGIDAIEAALLAAAGEAPSPLPEDTSPPDLHHDLVDPAAGPSALDPALPIEVVFIDAGVEDSESWIENLRSSGADDTQWLIVHLASDQNGIEQVTRTLAELSSVDAVHLLSRGAGEGVQLGNVQLDQESSLDHAGDIASWGHALDTHADILIYGSDLQATEAGRDLVEMLALVTQAEVATRDGMLGEVLGDELSHELSHELSDVAVDEDGSRHEVVFVQSTLYDLDQLTADLLAGDSQDRILEVIVLDQYANGFEQIDAALSQYTDIDAIHFVTHGADGFIQLGGSWLSAHNVGEHFDALARWGMSLTESGDILIYGCDVAATEFGQGLIDNIALATRADVAASTDGTGGLARGGNWTLEYVGGSGFSPVGLGDDRLEAYPTIETENVFGVSVQESYGGLLATYTVTNTNNSGAGSLRQAILDANANPGLDSIVFDISLNDINHVYYRDDGVAGSFSTPVRTTVADASITDFDADYLPGTARSWYRISLSGMDLEVTDSVIIDGSTQFGYDAAKGPIIELNAAGVTASDPNALTLSGGASTVRGLVINSGKDDAIEIDVNAHGSTIVGNYLGTDVSGLQTTFGNRYGITVKSDGNTIGGTTIADRNIIAANGSHSDSFGIGFWTDAHNNTVQGNYIGVGLDGSTAMSNVYGILFKNTSYDNLIGGTTAGAGNVISGNSEDGIRIDGTASGTIIQGNYIGTDATGTVAIGNGDDGISVMTGASNTKIGGSTAGARNIISANGSTGIYLEGTHTIVQGNYIGTDVTGTLDLGNTKVTTSEGSIRLLNVSGATIGGTGAGEGNLIAFGGGRGILLQGTSSGIAILGNSIHSHAGLGIDLGDDGVTLNDGEGPGNPDQDSGANSLQNFPELYEVTAGPTPTITFLMSSTPNRTFRVEFFASPSGNASGHGEGQRYLGFVNVTTNSEGIVKSTVTLNQFIATGEQVSATATSLTTRETSEFALNVTATNTAPVLDDSQSPALTPQDEDSGPPSGAVGTLISSLVDFATPAGQVDNVSDADPGAALGVAITAANTTYGTWYYSINGGSTWNSLGAVSDSNARLLAADANTRLYFQPHANYNGTLADAITFRAWDQTSGVNGGTSPITLGTYHVLDTFSSQSYSNNHGSQSWSTNWVESDSQGGGAGDGRFRVSGGRLQMQVTNAGNWIYREVDLSGAVSANFSFSYTSGLGGNAKVHAQVSHDGGATYTTLAGGIFDGSTNKLHFRRSPEAPVRFRPPTLAGVRFGRGILCCQVRRADLLKMHHAAFYAKSCDDGHCAKVADPDCPKVGRCDQPNAHLVRPSSPVPPTRRANHIGASNRRSTKRCGLADRRLPRFL